MLIHLHSQATTTPKVRAMIQESDEVGTVLAERFGDEEDQKTVRRTVFPTNAADDLQVAQTRQRRGVRHVVAIGSRPMPNATRRTGCKPP